MILTETDLTLAQVARRLEEAGITWAVFAGAAASAYGATRPITDVDILVPSTEGERLAALFPRARVERRADGAVKAVILPGFDLIARLSLVDLDDEMAARLTRHEIAGVVVPVIPPEDNLLIKAIFGRGPEVGKHDWADVRAMLAHLPAPDWAYLRWRADRCPAADEAQAALRRLRELAR